MIWKELLRGDDMVNKEQFEFAIERYLIEKRWKIITVDGEKIYVRNTNNNADESIELTKLYRTNEIADVICKIFIQRELKESHYENIVNPYTDSDFIIAALQYVNGILYGNKKPIRELVYSFQPVIRPVPEGETIENGFLRTFINVGTVGIKQEFEDYCNQLELWLDILSACHIYISRIGLKIKNNTRIFEGVGIEISVDGRELGQANYYIVEHNGESLGITDMGFGVERICWASNRWTCFATVFQCPEAYFLQLDDVSDRVNLIVVLIASGVYPGANGLSAVVRRCIRELLRKYGKLDYRPLIKYSVEQCHKYLTQTVNYVNIQEAFDKEVNRSICLEIKSDCKTNKFEKLIREPERYLNKLVECNIQRTVGERRNV